MASDGVSMVKRRSVGGEWMRDISCLTIALFLALVLPARAQGGAALADIRFGERSPSETRIVFDFVGSPQFRITGEAFGEGNRSGGTAEIYISVTNLTEVAAKAQQVGGRGVVSSARVDGALGGRRISVTLKEWGRVNKSFVISPSPNNPMHRLVIDVSKSNRAGFLASVERDDFDPLKEVIIASANTVRSQSATSPELEMPSKKRRKNSKEKKSAEQSRGEKLASAQDERVQAPTPPSAKATMLAAKPEKSDREKVRSAKSSRKPLIVIDPGHGGSDPGSIGTSGTHEKNVTLAAAKALRDILLQTKRYEVHLTRSGDERLALPQRTRIAREVGGDLFISLHADALKNPSVRGASVYTLNKEGTQRSASEAAETGDLVVFDVDLGRKAPEVKDILFDLAQQHTGNRSEQFAELLVAELADATPLLNNTHRRGNLKVLLAPDVPAVLLELGFISNAADEKNFVSAKWRKRTMRAVAGAIESYFDQEVLQRHASNDGAP